LQTAQSRLINKGLDTLSKTEQEKKEMRIESIWSSHLPFKDNAQTASFKDPVRTAL
jgi:hypothetical protein